MNACVYSGRSPVGRNFRSGRTVATPRCDGKLSLTRRSPCCGPATRMPRCRERGFAGPCSSHWTTIPLRVPVRSSKARGPRLPGRSSCTATSGRPRTAGPFPASRRILAVPQMMTTCAFVGIARYAKVFCFLYCQAPSPMRLSGSTSAQHEGCSARSSARTWSRTAWRLSGDGIGSCQSLRPTGFDGGRWTRMRAPFCPSQSGARHRRPFAGSSWPLAANAWAMSYSSMTRGPVSQASSTSGPSTASNAS